MNEIAPSNSSPFDSIRKATPDGGEFWTARDLQELLGYDQWRRFEDTIERAMAAIKNSGAEPTDHIADAGKMVSIGSGTTRLVADYKLTRYGAYMVAQNGDPRKHQIAAAQTYFAVKTREAETSQMLDLKSIDPRTFALKILEASDRADAAEAKVAELAGPAEAFAKFMDTDGSLPLGAVANIYKVGRTTLFDWLRLAKVLQADRRPYQEYAHWFEVKATHFERSSGMSGVSYTSRLRPTALDSLYRLLVRRGYVEKSVAS